MDYHSNDFLSGIDQYFTIVTQHLENVLVSQRQMMARVADLWTEVIQKIISFMSLAAVILAILPRVIFSGWWFRRNHVD